MTAPMVCVPDVDWLANVIRTADGNHSLGAGALAEAIVAAMSAAPAPQPVQESETTIKADAYDMIAEAIEASGPRVTSIVDYVIGLIPQPVQGEAGAVVDWAKDAREFGKALNDAGWEFIEHCPEKSALLFNNTKVPLRLAILKYLEQVVALAQQANKDTPKASA